MTDHYAETNRLIDGLHNLEGHNADFDMALAQVHATLALAEQQRIANLIALAEPGRATVNGARAALAAPYTGSAEEGSAHMTIRPEVARALRIETP